MRAAIAVAVVVVVGMRVMIRDKCLMFCLGGICIAVLVY